MVVYKTQITRYIFVDRVVKYSQNITSIFEDVHVRSYSCGLYIVCLFVIFSSLHHTYLQKFTNLSPYIHIINN